MIVDVQQTSLIQSEHRGPESDNRPVLAIVCNAQTPYRLHLHRRIAAEIPELKLHSLYEWPVGFDEFTAVEDSIGPIQMCDARPSPLPGRLAQEWATGSRTIRWLERQKLAAVLVLGYSDLTRFRVLRWSQSRKIPTLVWADSNILLDQPTGIRRIIKRRFLHKLVGRCDAWLPCGTRGRDYFLRYGARPERVFFFPNEPDYGKIRDLSQEFIADVRRRFGLCGDRRRVVFSGRLIELKRIPLAIDAFTAIAAERPEWDLIIMGDGELRKPLEARVPAELRSRVKFLGYVGDGRVIGAVYRSSDVLVLPSRYDAWALVVNEAAAAGMALITSHVVGAAPELLREGVNGYTFPSGDVNALADRLRKTTDPANIDRMKAASPGILAEWCAKADPIRGLRQALASCGVLERA